MAAGIFEPHILQDLCLDLDMELLGNRLAHAMHLAVAARAGLLIVGKVVFDTLARQIFRQRSAAALLSRCAFDRRQACFWKVDVAVVTVIFIRSLFGLVEDAINVLFATWSKAMEPCECQLLFQLDDPARERFLLGFKRGNFGSICRQLRH
ncbi:hypothetical protein N183_35710 [Sinorhizobium sp. Sb3]|nr:hypothetical protein N183_35710 [Sinorhizobium sp. Sb3]